MKRFTLCLALALPLLTSFGCAVDGSTPATEQTQQLSGFTFDSRALETPPSAFLPKGLLTLESFTDAVITRSLIQTSESFSDGLRVGTLSEKLSPNWQYVKDDAAGTVTVLRTTPADKPIPQDDAALQKSAQQRLSGFGITSVETGRVLQKRALLQDQDDAGNVSDPTVHRYKTFVFRALNGVPVEGHRAVISHAVDGSFYRAYIKWPALARTGNQLTTRLQPAEIITRATSALNAEGETSGNVRLSWKYVPTTTTTGEVTLSLKVSAHLYAAKASQEAREINVELDGK